MSVVRLVTSEGVNFTLGQETWLQALRIYGEKFYYTEKGTEKASDIDITRGQKVAHSLVCVGLYILFQFSAVTQSCPTICNPMDCSMPGLHIHHQLPEFTQTHVH